MDRFHGKVQKQVQLKLVTSLYNAHAQKLVTIQHSLRKQNKTKQNKKTRRLTALSCLKDGHVSW